MLIGEGAGVVASDGFQKAQCTSGRYKYLISPFMCVSRPTTPTGVGQHARVRSCTRAKKEGGSLVRGTEESDRTAPPTPAAIEVCSRAVLPGSRGAEHQATRAVPQPTDNACSACHHLVQLGDEESRGGYSPLCQSASRIKLILGLSSTSKVEDLWTTRLGTAYCHGTPFSLIAVTLYAMQNSSHLVTSTLAEAR